MRLVPYGLLASVLTCAHGKSGRQESEAVKNTLQGCATEPLHAVELMPGIQPVTYTHAHEHACTHKEQTQFSVYQFSKHCQWSMGRNPMWYLGQ